MPKAKIPEEAAAPSASSNKARSTTSALKKAKLDRTKSTPSESVKQNGQSLGRPSGKEQVDKHEGSHTTDASGAGPSNQIAKDEADGEHSRTTSRKLGRADEGKQSSLPSQSPRSKIRKLAPPRPFPTVPTSASATGPRSAHSEGKNQICVTRKTELGMYLRRCKEVVLNDGYKTLYLHAMGAAIPHLSRLAVSLPSILPFPASDIQTEVWTGTAELQDEIIPDDEDEDITLRTRGKSTMSVIIKIEGGDEEESERLGKSSKKKGESPSESKKSGARQPRPEPLVFTENDLGSDDSEVAS